LKQFILDSGPDKDGVVRLEGKDFRYLARVRRLAAGESFPALLPNGEEAVIKIISVNNKILTGQCEGNGLQRGIIIPPSSQEIPPIILMQALPKAGKMDLIVRQAAEGGISEIVPFFSEFSVLKDGADGRKFSRWEKIIKEARQQSGSKTATTVHHPLKLNELFSYWQRLKEEGAVGIFFHHLGLEQDSLHGYLNNNPKKAALAVGPEGGFSEREVSLFLENGLAPLTIGDTVLRTETAALYCSAAVRVLLLERNSWELKKT